MMSLKTLALSGALPISFALSLLAAAPAMASEPDSTPAEQAQTQQLNQGITNANAAADAQSTEQNAVYQAQQTRYQEQLRLYRASQTNYEERAARYLAARDRYVAGRALYHRAGWPSRYQQRLIVDTNDLLGARVDTANGRKVGHVVEIALVAGKVDALRVTLDNRSGDVWIESADLRFDADKKIVMTNLNRRDLVLMTHETY
jgi:multidrug efflux pump subunit AcrA (membrane-fusion protein)